MSMVIKEYPMELLPKENNRINNAIYLTSNGTVIKNCTESPNYPDPVDIRLITFANIGPLMSFTYPYTLLAEKKGWIYGYEMEYLKDYHTLLAFINDDSVNLPFTAKKSLLLQIYKDLRTVNKSYIVGDINLTNIMISSDGIGKVIDYENGKPINIDVYPVSLYELYGMSSLQEDAFKMFISSLSLIYKANFETLFRSKSIDEIISIAESLKLDQIVIDYLYDFSHEIYTKSGIAIYFDDYLREVSRIKENACQRVRNRVEKEICIYE